MIKNRKEKFEEKKESKQNKKEIKIIALSFPHSRLRHEDAIMNKHYYN